MRDVLSPQNMTDSQKGMLEDVDFIIRIAKEKAGGKLYFLLNRVVVMMYVKMAAQIKSIMKSGNILDWGCGYGQLSYLLKKSGFSVTSYDINQEDELNNIREKFGVKCIGENIPGILPFNDGCFDAVAACGVLEHVNDMNLSLNELYRVLNNNGILFIYMLPNKYSYTEFIAHIAKRSAHERISGLPIIKEALKKNNFVIKKMSYANAIPKNLTKISPRVADIYNLYYKQLIKIDELMTKIPILNCFSGVYSIVCNKKLDG